MTKPLTFPAEGGRDFVQLEPGSYAAVCNLVCYMGMQPGSTLYPAPKPQVHLRFEVPGERITYNRDGQDVEGPQTIGESLTASMSPKATLRHQLESWRGKSFTDAEAAEFDVSKLLGAPVLLSVTQKAGKDGKPRSRIATLARLPKGMPKPQPENPLLYYSVDDPDPQAFQKLPEWLRKRCSARLQPEPVPEPAGAPPPDAGITDEELDDTIPF